MQCSNTQQAVAATQGKNLVKQAWSTENTEDLMLCVESQHYLAARTLRNYPVKLGEQGRQNWVDDGGGA